MNIVIRRMLLDAGCECNTFDLVGSLVENDLCVGAIGKMDV